MYLDVKGLVTTAVGNLIDSPEAALTLPWADRYGSPAAPATVRAEWAMVKGLQSMAKRGGLAFAAVTNLRLKAADIDQLVQTELSETAAHLAARAPFAAFESFPPPAQLALLDMAWNMGPMFAYPKLEAAATRGDWATCAAECATAGGPAARNDARKALFLAAIHAPDVLAGGWDGVTASPT
jgi:hypothetical protein